MHKKIDHPVVVALPWLSDMGHLDLGSRKELEFPGWVWDGEGVTVLVPNSNGCYSGPSWKDDDLSAPRCWQHNLPDPFVIAASFPEMQIQGTPSIPELLAVPSE